MKALEEVTGVDPQGCPGWDLRWCMAGYHTGLDPLSSNDLYPAWRSNGRKG